MSYWVVSGVVKKVWIAKKSQSPMTTSTKLSDPWISVLRSAVRSTMGEAGWKVGPSRAGKVFLQKVDLAPRGEKHPSVTVSLPYSWDESSVPAVITRRQAIQKVMALQECDLKQAALIAAGASSHRVEDWAGAVDAFEKFKRNFGKRIGDKTWAKAYRPALVKAVAVARRSNGPRTGVELLEEVSMFWEPGSRVRAMRVQTVAQFLRFCVERENFRKIWMPPATTREVVGEENASATPYPISDEGVLELLESLQGQPERTFAIQLLATYGLRAHDLHHLKIQRGELWSMYRKKAGGGSSTKPRQLAPLFVAGQDWNLLERFKAGEPLCPLGRVEQGMAADRLFGWLRRNPVWMRLKDEAAAKGEILRPTYAFRHRFLAEGQLRNIPPKVLAGYCGHSLQTHLQVYSKWNLRDNARDCFD